MSESNTAYSSAAPVCSLSPNKKNLKQCFTEKLWFKINKKEVDILLSSLHPSKINFFGNTFITFNRLFILKMKCKSLLWGCLCIFKLCLNSVRNAVQCMGL